MMAVRRAALMPPVTPASPRAPLRPRSLSPRFRNSTSSRSLQGLLQEAFGPLGCITPSHQWRQQEDGWWAMLQYGRGHRSFQGQTLHMCTLQATGAEWQCRACPSPGHSTTADGPDTGRLHSSRAMLAWIRLYYALPGTDGTPVGLPCLAGWECGSAVAAQQDTGTRVHCWNSSPSRAAVQAAKARGRQHT